MASDREVGHLNDLPNLRQLEVDIHNHFYQKGLVTSFSASIGERQPSPGQCFWFQVEFSDEPDDGLFAFLTEHPNRAQLTHLAIEV